MYRFDDGAGYERFMGRWSRAAGAVFLDWLALPANMHWLDVGCGTGVLTQLVLDTSSPASMIGVDPAVAQVEHARRHAIAAQVDYRVADAQALPFPEFTFDVVTSALVINFIPDQLRGLSEMRRVARPSGVVAGYVWDFAAECSPSWPLRRGLRQIGVSVPDVPGRRDLELSALHRLFGRAGLERIATRSIDVVVRFSDFDDFWQGQMPSYSPTTEMIAAMTTYDRQRLKKAVLTAIPADQDGMIRYSARANAIKAVVPR